MTTNLEQWIDLEQWIHDNCPSHKYGAKCDKFQELVAQGSIREAMRYSDDATMWEILSKYTQFVLIHALEARDLNKDYVETQINYVLARVMRENLVSHQSRIDYLEHEADKQKYHFLNRLLKVV